jgi:hypothetical protein
MMVRIDSRTETVIEAACPYMTSAPVDLDYHWGQPPASHYVFIVVGDTLRGQPISDIKEIYVSSHHMEYPPVIESQLDREFQAWDMLSDEALVSFEQELD